LRVACRQWVFIHPKENDMRLHCKILVGFTALTALSSAQAQMKPDELRAAREAYINQGCNSCHAMADNLAGPSLKAIAKRYKGKNVTAELATRIREGSSGRWGDLPHPAVAVTPAEATLMARWILAGAPGI
jgi:cytochrome c